MDRWYRDGGDILRTTGLALRPTSTVLDFGGYVGDYAAELRGRYDCIVHAFEPIPEFAEQMRQRFRGDPKVTVHDYAVGSTNGTLIMNVAADASGVFVGGGRAVEVRQVAMEDLAEQLPPRIAIVKLNIEGGEYDLIPAMADAGLINRTDRFFVQFHPVAETSPTDRLRCQSILAKQHVQDWDYPFVWESWSRPWGSAKV